MRKLKKINIAILAVSFHRSGLRDHQILRSPSPFSTLHYSLCGHMTDRVHR